MKIDATLTILIGFTARTVGNVTDALTKFYSNPTASQVSIAKSDSGVGLVFPHAVKCLQLQDEYSSTITAEEQQMLIVTFWETSVPEEHASNFKQI